MAASVLGEAFASDRFAGVKRPFGETFPPIANLPIANLTGRAKAGTRFSPIYPGFALGCTIDAMPGRIQPARESIVPILGRWVAERVIANA